MRVVEYICDVCGKREPWGKTWQWHGSFEDVENGIEKHVCSHKCKLEFLRDVVKEVQTEEHIKSQEKLFNKPNG